MVTMAQQMTLMVQQIGIAVIGLLAILGFIGGLYLLFHGVSKPKKVFYGIYPTHESGQANEDAEAERHRFV